MGIVRVRALCMDDSIQHPSDVQEFGSIPVIPTTKRNDRREWLRRGHPTRQFLLLLRLLLAHCVYAVYACMLVCYIFLMRRWVYSRVLVLYGALLVF